ncbi:hypothetical protein [Mycobacterium tuberculosis]|uniref:hypothetical protein n=1 Tax=Mycobacterium tuberculosis TaxID=1773 RepID=UPI003D7D5C4D
MAGPAGPGATVGLAAWRSPAAGGAGGAAGLFGTGGAVAGGARRRRWGWGAGGGWLLGNGGVEAGGRVSWAGEQGRRRVTPGLFGVGGNRRAWRARWRARRAGGGLRCRWPGRDPTGPAGTEVPAGPARSVVGGHGGVGGGRAAGRGRAAGQPADGVRGGRRQPVRTSSRTVRPVGRRRRAGDGG